MLGEAALQEAALSVATAGEVALGKASVKIVALNEFIFDGATLAETKEHDALVIDEGLVDDIKVAGGKFDSTTTGKVSVSETEVKEAEVDKPVVITESIGVPAFGEAKIVADVIEEASAL
jgi:hypothetical protein